MMFSYYISFVKYYFFLWKQFFGGSGDVHVSDRCAGPMGPSALKFSLDMAEAGVYPMASLQRSSQRACARARP